MASSPRNIQLPITLESCKLFDGLSIKTMLYDKWVDLIKEDRMFEEDDPSEWWVTKDNAQNIIDTLDINIYINREQILSFINSNSVY